MNKDPFAIDNVLFTKLHENMIDAALWVPEEKDHFLDLEAITMAINDMMEAELVYGPRKPPI